MSDGVDFARFAHIRAALGLNGEQLWRLIGITRQGAHQWRLGTCAPDSRRRSAIEALVVAADRAVQAVPSGLPRGSLWRLAAPAALCLDDLEKKGVGNYVHKLNSLVDAVVKDLRSKPTP